MGNVCAFSGHALSMFHGLLQNKYSRASDMRRKIMRISNARERSETPRLSIYLTTIPRAHVGYEMTDSQRGILWYIGSYTIIDKPIKSLELHYPMIHFFNKTRLSITTGNHFI